MQMACIFQAGNLFTGRSTDAQHQVGIFEQALPVNDDRSPSLAISLVGNAQGAADTGFDHHIGPCMQRAWRRVQVEAQRGSLYRELLLELQ